MQDYITVLEIIKLSDVDYKLKSACSEIIRILEEQKVKNIDTILDAVTVVGGKAIQIGGGYLIPRIPVIGKVATIVLFAIGITDFVFKIGKVSEACTYLYAITKASNVFGAAFKNNLSSGIKYGLYFSVYQDVKKIQSQYFNLVVLKETSEQMMLEADKANSFLIEWLFTEFMYKTDEINKNLDKLKNMRNNYIGVIR